MKPFMVTKFLAFPNLYQFFKILPLTENVWRDGDGKCLGVTGNVWRDGKCLARAPTRQDSQPVDSPTRRKMFGETENVWA